MYLFVLSKFSFLKWILISEIYQVCLVHHHHHHHLEKMMKIWKSSIVLIIKKKQHILLFLITIKWFKYFLHQQSNHAIHGGLVLGRSFIHCDRESANCRFFINYFAENINYNDVVFPRGYHMSHPPFLRIMNAVETHGIYFTQQTDIMSRFELTSLQK